MSWDRARRTPLALLFGLLSACGDGQDADADGMNAPATGSESSGAADGTAGSSAPGSVAQGSKSLPGNVASTPGGNVSTTGTMQPTAAAAGSAAQVTAGAAASGMPTSPLTPLGPGMCCPDGECLCRGEPPATLSAPQGPHSVMQYELPKIGCVFYPTDAPPPYAAVAIADGFGGSGGCDSVQSAEWGPLYASHGIVAMIIETGTGDQANARGEALLAAIATFKAENEKSESPLFGKLAGRYGTAGFSTGGGGSTFAAHTDNTLRSSVAVMPWGATEAAGSVPTLVMCGDSDGVAPCATYGKPAYAGVSSSVPKMLVTVTSGHNGQPSAASGASGGYVLAFQKLFLEGDERWRPLLIMAGADETTIQ